MPGTLGSVDRVNKQEESIDYETWQVALAGSEPDLLPCLQVIDGALSVIFQVFVSVSPQSDIDHRLLHLILRVYNAIAASLLLAKSGYYQQAFSIQRELLEHALLLEYFYHKPSDLITWATCSGKDRQKQFSPAKIRKFLNDLDDFSSIWRDRIYSALSTYSVHPTPESWQFAKDGNKLYIGPFFDPVKLKHSLFDLCKWASWAVFQVSRLPIGKDKALTEKAAFLDINREWARVYMPGWNWDAL